MAEIVVNTIEKIKIGELIARNRIKSSLTNFGSVGNCFGNFESLVIASAFFALCLEITVVLSILFCTVFPASRNIN